MRRVPRSYRNQWRAAKKLSRAARLLERSWGDRERWLLLGIDKEFREEMEGISRRLRLLSSQLEGLDVQGCPRDE